MRELVDEVVDEVDRIVLRAVDEARLATPQEVEPDPVEARRIDDHAAVVAHQALAIEHRHVEPRVVGTEAGGPHDRADLAAAQVDAQPRRRLDDRRLGAPRRLQLAVELAPRGVTVNAVCPGPIRTGMTAGIPEEDKQKFARRRVPMRRYGEPIEVAQMVLSLVLPAASYISGAVVPVDGGLTVQNT